MTDIVERLRAAANGIGSMKTERGDYGLLDEAAAEIERLRSEASKMQARLDRWEPKPVANAGSFLTGGEARCNKHLAALGRPYPRTCLVCRLGPCRDEIVPHEAMTAPQPHKEEGG